MRKTLANEFHLGEHPMSSEQQAGASGGASVLDSGVRDAYAVQYVLSRLLQISLAPGSLEEHLALALREVLSIPWLALQSKGAIFLVGERPGTLLMKAQLGLPEAVKKECASVPFGRCLCGRTAVSHILTHGDDSDERHERKFPGMSPHGHYCVPVLMSGRLLGVINLYLNAGHIAKQRHLEALQSIAAVIAGIIEHRRMEEHLRAALSLHEKVLNGTVEMVAAIVERRDPYTAGHQRRVANMAHAIADEMKLSQECIDGVRLAGLVHDVGKIGVPAEILSNPGRLTEPEMGIVRQHAEIGYEILKGIEFPWPIAEIVHQHHERMDGSGYPCGLAGQNILMEARIMAVADVVEAMASHRPYRPALGMNRAMQEIALNRGKLYDSDVADAAAAIVREKGFVFA